MKNLIIITLVLLGSVMTSCTKDYSCVTTLTNTEGKVNNLSTKYISDVTNSEIEAYKTQEIAEREAQLNDPTVVVTVSCYNIN